MYILMSTSKSTHLFSYDRNKIQPLRSKYYDPTILFVETPCFGIVVYNDIEITAKALEEKEK